MISAFGIEHADISKGVAGAAKDLRAGWKAGRSVNRSTTMSRRDKGVADVLVGLSGKKSATYGYYGARGAGKAAGKVKARLRRTS